MKINTIRKRMETDCFYEVEKILKKRVRKGVVEYFIKWKGYGSKSNTWEPGSNILDHTLIKNLEFKNKRKSKKCRKTLISGDLAKTHLKNSPNEIWQNEISTKCNTSIDSDKSIEQKQHEPKKTVKPIVIEQDRFGTQSTDIAPEKEETENLEQLLDGNIVLQFEDGLVFNSQNFEKNTADQKYMFTEEIDEDSASVITENVNQVLEGDIAVEFGGDLILNSWNAGKTADLEYIYTDHIGEESERDGVENVNNLLETDIAIEYEDGQISNSEDVLSEINQENMCTKAFGAVQSMPLDNNSNIIYKHKNHTITCDTENQCPNTLKTVSLFETNTSFEGVICNQRDSTNIGENCSVIKHKVDFRNLNINPSKECSKRYYCIYCKKTVTNFGRHLLTTHKNIPDVRNILEKPIGDPERLMNICDIRRKGQFLHNTEPECNTGSLFVRRRPSKTKQRTADHYKPCPQCKEMFSILSLRVHYRKCSNKFGKDRNIFVKSRKLQMKIHSIANEKLVGDILCHSREDDITKSYMYDELCITYGNRLTRKYRNHHHFTMIRQRMREIEKFVYEFKKRNPTIKCLRDILDPEHYDEIVNVINYIAGLDEDTGRFRAPSTAYSLGLHLKSIAIFLETECIKSRDNIKRESVRDLLCLMRDGFTIDVNKTVAENQSEYKRHKKIKLPSAADITSLNSYLSVGRKQAFESLKREFSHKAWRDLAGFTLISLQLFNRRRAGEIERICIKDYERHTHIEI
ncbi:uncharacterized protein isoform X2 [Leptinotarsa decemlineata]|uniref:uncharacterized protein isoform X2 n=1 Tax=Leptinotarsa decemlineata TaxID=7539 RepID=UPI003D3068E6